MTLPIAIACDHAGFPLKDIIKEAFPEYEWLDLGTDDATSVDYPDFGHKLADAIKDGQVERGILICGTGIGIAIAANRHKHIRCASVSEPTSARLTRLHNDANVLAFGARIIGTEVAIDCVRAFLGAEYEGGRHQKRVDKLGA